MIESVISRAEELISNGEPFEFWKLLESSEKELRSIKAEIGGDVEQGATLIGDIFIGKRTVVKSGTRIEGKVYIGQDCVIGPNAFLRSGTIIADKCHIGTSEIKNSIILSGSYVPHYSYVGDSVIGRNCNLGAGTKIANLRHDNASVKVMLQGKKIDSGRRKLGALLFDDVKCGVNCSINCGAILLKGARVLPGQLVK